MKGRPPLATARADVARVSREQTAHVSVPLATTPYNASDSALVRPAPDLALRIRRRHLRAGVERGVQSAARAGAGARLAAIGGDAFHCWRYVTPVANSPNYLEMEPSIARPTRGQGRIDCPREIDAALVRRGCPRLGR